MTPPEALEQLCARVEELERRVQRLEKHRPSAEIHNHDARLDPLPGIPRQEQSFQFGPALTAIGIALLGIAGAYVLRALAGSSVLPPAVFGFTGAAYAIGWAVAAQKASRRFAGGFYAATSVLILGPMLWEMCLRFQAMNPPTAAAIMSTALIATLLAAHGRYSVPEFSLTWAGSALTALALCVGTRQMMPFIATLLAMIAFAEFQRMHGKMLRAAAFVTLAADAAVLALLLIYRMPAAARPEYPELSPAAILAAPLLLFLIQAASIVNQACILRQRLAVLDAFQMMAAFALFGASVFWIVAPAAGSVVGTLCAVLSAGCYWGAYDPAIRAPAAKPIHQRNFRLFTAWALILLIAALFLLLPQSGAAIGLSLAATAAILAARALRSTVLHVHALVFLIVGVIASGLLLYEGRAIIGHAAPRADWGIALVAVLSVAAVGAWPDRDSDDARQQVMHFAFALLAASAACAFLARGTIALAAMALSPEAFRIALLRTISLCAVALALAAGGVRLHRPAMTRVAYVLLGFVVLKLVVEDLRHGHLAFLAASIGIVAMTLIAVARVAARTQGGR